MSTPTLTVLYDTREQTPFEALPGIVMVRATVDDGDYTTLAFYGGGRSGCPQKGAVAA